MALRHAALVPTAHLAPHEGERNSADFVRFPEEGEAPVSVPVAWDELDRLSGPKDFTVAEVPLRVLAQGSKEAADPWAQYGKLKQKVPESLTRDLSG